MLCGHRRQGLKAEDLHVAVCFFHQVIINEAFAHALSDKSKSDGPVPHFQVEIDDKQITPVHTSSLEKQFLIVNLTTRSPAHAT